MPPLPDDIKPIPEGPWGRNWSRWSDKDGAKVQRLVEWSTTEPHPFEAHIQQVALRIPTDLDSYRPEEVRTLRIDGTLRHGDKMMVSYNCGVRPTSLHELLKHVRKPSVVDRCKLAGVIATQVRSLFVHFDMVHLALRTNSFVFFLNPYKPDLSKPYLVDWTRAPSPLHQHPDYRPYHAPAWYYDAWSLLVILSEIAEWKPLSTEGVGALDEWSLRERKLKRRIMVADETWKGLPTAMVFKYGFGVLDRERNVLEGMDRWEVKRFYDRLCEMFAKL